MIKQTITYEDLDGNQKTEDFYFRITKAEFVKSVIAEGGDSYLEKLNKLVNDPQTNGRELMKTFEMLLRDAVGKRSGAQFIKTEELTNHFMFSGAYDAFFMELIQTPDSGATFMRGILPGDMKGVIDEEMKKRGMNVPAEADEEAKVNAQIEAIENADTSEAAATPFFQNLAKATAPAEPTPFPQSLEKAVEAQKETPELQTAPPVVKQGKNEDEPKWLQENRYPTQKELMSMPQGELQLAMKMKSAKAFG